MCILRKKTMNKAIFPILLVSLFLNLFALDFGLPSEERLEMAFSGKEDIKIKEGEIRKVMEKGTWRRSEFAGGEDRKEMADWTHYFDLMRTYHPDEQYTLKMLANMNPKKFDFNPKNFVYMPFYSYQIGFGIALGALLKYVHLTKDMFYYLLNPEEFARMYLAGRMVVSLLGTGIIFLIYLIGCSLFSKGVGLLSAATMSVIPLFVSISHFIKPDVPCLFWSMMAFLFITYLYKSGRLKWYILSGIFIGLASGSKHYGIFLIVPLSLAHMLFLRDTGKFRPGNIFSREIFFSFISILFAFFCASPYILTDFDRFLRDVTWLKGAVSIDCNFRNICDLSFYYVISGFQYVFSPGIFMLFILSFFAKLKEREGRYLLLLAPVFLYFILILFSANRSIEYALPAFPLLSILSASFVLEGTKRSEIKSAVPGLKLTFSILAILLAFVYSAGYVYSMKFADVRMDASRWIADNIKPDSSLGVEKYPVIYRMPSLNPGKYRIATINSLDDDRISRIDYFISSSFEWKFFGFHDYLGRESLREDLGAKLVESGKFRILKRFETMPSVLGIKMTKDYQLCGTLETIFPAFIVLERVE